METEDYTGWIWRIKSEKQDNGLCGTPMQLVKLDRLVWNTSEENRLKHSAIVTGIAEAYPDETFEIFWSDENGFFATLSKSGTQKIRYTDYKLEGNVLRWVG